MQIVPIRRLSAREGTRAASEVSQPARVGRRFADDGAVVGAESCGLGEAVFKGDVGNCETGSLDLVE